MSDQVGRSLAALIAGTFINFTGAVRVEPLASTDWASVTFSGARHRLRVVLDGPGAVGAAADFLKEMPELDLPIPRHIVADLVLVGEERREGGAYACLDLEALTIEEC
ncbi:MAG TPA: hypothetical protein VGB54_07330 [Allosphingosinicella sp.]